MDVISPTEIEQREIDADVFVAKGLHRDILNEYESGIDISVSEITFRPGERTKFHTHPNGQILYVTEGNGMVGTEYEQLRIKKGDTVYFSGGENHWHGATDSSTVTHLSIIPYEGDQSTDSIGDNPIIGE